MSKKTKYAGKWLNLHEISFINASGESREWEYATRTGNGGAVCVVAITDDPEPQLILIRQFRPPIGNFAIEFPAGLVETGESLEATALRELEEETGYKGQIVHVGPSIFSSPGLTDEKISLVTVIVNEKGETRHDDDENIRVLSLPMKNLIAELNKLEAAGAVLDAKLWSFAYGLGFRLPDS